MANDLVGNIFDRLKGYFQDAGQGINQGVKSLSDATFGSMLPMQKYQMDQSGKMAPVTPVPMFRQPDQTQSLQQTLSPSPSPSPMATPMPMAKAAPTPIVKVNGVDPRFPALQTTQVPGSLSDVIYNSAQAKGINPNLLAALLYQESNFKPSSVNPGSGDYGIAQINLASHPGVTKEQAFDPSFAVPFAANMLANNLKHFGGDLNRAIAGYNVGQGGASVNGPMEFGGGPKGQYYLDNVIRNISPQLIQQLGLKPSKSLQEEFRKAGRM